MVVVDVVCGNTQTRQNGSLFSLLSVAATPLPPMCLYDDDGDGDGDDYDLCACVVVVDKAIIECSAAH